MNRKIGVIYSYVMMFVQVFSAVLFTPLLIRTLGPSEYGVYQLVYSITAYIALLDLGVGNAVIRYMAKYRANNDTESQRKFMGVATAFYLMVSAIVLLVGVVLVGAFPLIFAKGLNEAEIALGRKLLIVTVLSSALTLGTSGFSNTLMAFERFSFINLVRISLDVFKLVASITVLVSGGGSVGVVLLYFVINIVLRGIYTYYVLFKLKIRPSFKKIQFSFVRETVSYSAFVLLQMISVQINSMTDSVLLGIMAKGSSFVIAIYGAGAQVVQYFKTVGTQMSGVLMPGVVRLVESGAKAKDLQNEMARIGRIILMMLGMVFTIFVVNGQQFIVLWAGENYEQAYLVAVAIMLPTMFNMVQAIGNQILWALNKHRMQAVIQLVSAVLNVILTAFLIKWNPLIGAVIGSVIALTVGDILCMNVMFKKEIGISLLGYYKNLLHGILPSLLLSAVGGLIFNQIGLSVYGWFGLIVNCLVMIAIYGICMLTFGMNSSEKCMISNMLKKVMKKFHLIKGE